MPMHESPIHFHTCGYPIYVDSRWNGRTWEPVFVDAKVASPTEGEAVKYCPACHSLLQLRDIQPLA
jgi:hypothetical protein